MIYINPAHLKLAKRFSSHVLVGPPLDDRLLALVAHLFSPEEAGVALFITPYSQSPLEKIARRSGMEVSGILPLLDAMDRRRVIYRGDRGYALFPLYPGMFEYILMDGSDSPWHRKYAALLDECIGSGYLKKYNNFPKPIFQNVPVKVDIENSSHVVGPAFIDELMSHHDSLSVLNVCQCRQTANFSGRGCKRSGHAEGCLVFGSLADLSLEKGTGRRVTENEMRAIIRERTAMKLVFMTANVDPSNSNVVCTCCSCCCKMLISVEKFNGIVAIARPRSIAHTDGLTCSNCGKCAAVCNTHAHGMTEGVHRHDPVKCIGCGLCVAACGNGAISMVKSPSYRPPAKSYKKLIARLIPNLIISRVIRKLSS